MEFRHWAFAKSTGPDVGQRIPELWSPPLGKPTVSAQGRPKRRLGGRKEGERRVMERRKRGGYGMSKCN